MQPVWKTVWQYFLKLNIYLPYDTAMLLLGIYSGKICKIFSKRLHKNLHSSMIHNCPQMETSLMPSNSREDRWIEWEWTVSDYTQWYGWISQTIFRESQMQKMTVSFHLFKAQAQAKLISVIRNQDSGYPWGLYSNWKGAWEGFVGE